MVIAFLVGLLFGAGLMISQMVDPAKVIGFLNVTGQWDPSLIFVLAGAVIVFGAGYSLIVLRMRKPLIASHFDLPTSKKIDLPLVLGAAVFGVGWGLVGICPGPALTNLASGAMPILLFVVAMLGGMFFANQLKNK